MAEPEPSGTVSESFFAFHTELLKSLRVDLQKRHETDREAVLMMRDLRDELARARSVDTEILLVLRDLRDELMHVRTKRKAATKRRKSHANGTKP
jgi:hypothetical protein